jgi:hypothetical protein
MISESVGIKPRPHHIRAPSRAVPPHTGDPSGEVKRFCREAAECLRQAEKAVSPLYIPANREAMLSKVWCGLEDAGVDQPRGPDEMAGSLCESFAGQEARMGKQGWAPADSRCQTRQPSYQFQMLELLMTRQEEIDRAVVVSRIISQRCIVTASTFSFYFSAWIMCASLRARSPDASFSTDRRAWPPSL